MHFDLANLIQTVGYVGLFCIVFAESGLFFGFFLPGDSLLFTAGFLASAGIFNIWTLVPILVIAAILGDSAGYWMGRNFGDWLRKQKESFFFKKHHLEKAEVFYKKHGVKTIFLARFVPFIRTFAPIAAGLAKMHYSTFISYNFIGGIAWGAGVTLAGYFLGSIIPDVDKYLYPIIGGIVLISLIPVALHWYQERTSYKHMHPKAGKLEVAVHNKLLKRKK